MSPLFPRETLETERSEMVLTESIFGARCGDCAYLFNSAPSALRSSHTLFTDFGLPGPPIQSSTAYPLPTDAPRASSSQRASGLRRHESEWGVWAGVLEEERKEEVPPQMAVSLRRATAVQGHADISNVIGALF